MNPIKRITHITTAFPYFLHCSTVVLKMLIRGWNISIMFDSQFLIVVNTPIAFFQYKLIHSLSLSYSIQQFHFSSMNHIRVYICKHFVCLIRMLQISRMNVIPVSLSFFFIQPVSFFHYKPNTYPTITLLIPTRSLFQYKTIPVSFSSLNPFHSIVVEGIGEWLTLRFSLFPFVLRHFLLQLDKCIHLDREKALNRLYSFYYLPMVER